MHSRTTTEKYEIFKEKLTKEKPVLESHGNMKFQHRRYLDGLKDNLQFMINPRKKQKVNRLLVSYSMFIENGEVGVIALKASSLFEMKINHSMKQMNIINKFQKAVDDIVVFKFLFGL